MTVLNLDRLSKDFILPGGVVPALRGLTLQVESGERMVLLGPSGAGKTTVLRLIAGVLDPTAGEITFDGRSVLRVPPERRGAVMVFQRFPLFPFLSVEENVAFGLRVRGIGRDAVRRRVAEALALVRLSGLGSRRADELSGGQQQRVALARALVIEPRLLLLDEPLSHLDPELREDLRLELIRLQEESHLTTIFVTHDRAEAVLVAHRIGLLMDGELVQVGMPRDFYEKPANARVANFFGATNIFAARKHGDTLETPWGRLVIAANKVSDGEVLVAIRPEAIRLEANGVNSFAARVTGWTYQGETARCRAVLGECSFEVGAPPFSPYQPGDPITLHFPPKHLWLMPPEATGQ